jgi:hypothetical protein
LGRLKVQDVYIVTERKGGGSQFRRLDAEALSDWLKSYSVSELWEKNVIGGGPLE